MNQGFSLAFFTLAFFLFLFGRDSRCGGESAVRAWEREREKEEEEEKEEEKEKEFRKLVFFSVLGFFGRG